MNKLRCRSFRSYTGQQKPRCNRGNPCEACTLLHFLVWFNGDPMGLEMEPEEIRYWVEDYIRRFPK